MELHSSLFADMVDRSMLAPSFGYGLRAGVRWVLLGAFFQVEHNIWRTTEYRRELVPGALNIALGGELNYGGGLVRTSLALGPSFLLYDTMLDDAGEVGIFLEIRPVGLRWRVGDHLTIGLDPLTFDVVAPVLSGIPLVYVQYRTVLTLEWMP